MNNCINVVLNNNHKEFCEYMESLDNILLTIKSLIDQKELCPVDLRKSLRDLKHTLFLMKYINYPQSIKHLKNKVINYFNILESICFEVEEETLSAFNMVSKKSLGITRELTEEVHKILGELKYNLY